MKHTGNRLDYEITCVNFLDMLYIAVLYNYIVVFFVKNDFTKTNYNQL